MEALPEKNIFMMCEALNKNALTVLPSGFSVRNCRRDEFAVWKAFPFDDRETVREYDSFMTDYFNSIYAEKEDLFYERTLFVCDEQDLPVATCMVWKAYDEFNTIHWFKVLKEYEGKGIGRALFSIIMKSLDKQDYPVYLHTQPESFRAVKLYSDFGFSLLSGKKFGTRENHLEESLLILKENMPEKYFNQLKIVTAPDRFVQQLKKYTTIQF